MSATPNMGFRFLDLPAELRNRIYDLAATTDDPIRITREKPLHHPHSYAGLTRVCRQIRNEYLVIQRRSARLEVAWKELPHYMATFHTDKSNDLRPQYLGIRLTFTYEPYEEDDYSEPGVDILPILQLNAESTDMIVCVTTVHYEGAFPEYPKSILDEARCELQELIDNNDEEWVRCIRLGCLNSIVVRQETRYWSGGSIDIVFGVDHKDGEVLKQVKKYSKARSIRELMRRFGFGNSDYLCCGHFVVDASFIMDNSWESESLQPSGRDSDDCD